MALAEGGLARRARGFWCVTDCLGGAGRPAGDGCRLGVAVARTRAVARDDVGFPLQSLRRLATAVRACGAPRLPRPAGRAELRAHLVWLCVARANAFRLSR